MELDKLFTPVKGHLVVRSHKIENSNSTGIIMPDTQEDSYVGHKEWVDENHDIRIIAIASDIKDVKVGDRVFLNKNTTKQKLKELLTKFIDKENKELDKYFIIKFDDILCVVNK